MERLQIIYNNGTSIQINACNGAYTIITNELRKEQPAKFAMPPEKSRYKYCVSLENVTCVNKLAVDTAYTVGFTTGSAKKQEGENGNDAK